MEQQCFPSRPRNSPQSRGPRALAGQSASCSAARPGFRRAREAPLRPETGSPALVRQRRAGSAALRAFPGRRSGRRSSRGRSRRAPASDSGAPLSFPPHSAPPDPVCRREPRPLPQTLASSLHPLPSGKLRGGAGGRATSVSAGPDPPPPVTRPGPSLPPAPRPPTSSGRGVAGSSPGSAREWRPRRRTAEL